VRRINTSIRRRSKAKVEASVQPFAPHNSINSNGLIKTPFDEYGNYRHREPTEAITDEEDDDDDESYAGSHSSEDTVLRADSILSEEQEELHESETQGIIEVFQAVCNLKKYRYGIIKIDTSEPDYSHIPVKEYDWSYTCYRGAKELIPNDAPKPLGKPVVTTSYVDANLYHDLISGRSVTGVLHLWNSTPIDWYSKLQGTVEMAT
jgi:hypothetical protein